MIDVFSQSQGIEMNTVHCKAIFGQGMFYSVSFYYLFHYVFMYMFYVFSKCLHFSGFVDDTPVFLAKPQTYMNLSGESVCYSYIIVISVILPVAFF